MVRVFEGQADEALEDDKAWFEDDPEGFRKAKPRATITDGVPEHPWGEDILARCRRWLSATDYEVWKVYEDCRTAAKDALRDCLLGLTDGSESGRSVQESVERFRRR